MINRALGLRSAIILYFALMMSLCSFGLLNYPGHLGYVDNLKTCVHAIMLSTFDKCNVSLENL
jgi:hypothetical protein